MQLTAVVSPETIPTGAVSGRVVLINAVGGIADSAAVGIKTRACGWEVELTIDRTVTLAAAGPMVAVELQGERGQSYRRYAFNRAFSPGDQLIVSPSW